MKEEKCNNIEISQNLARIQMIRILWVGLLVENFVDLDDGMVEMMNRILAAEKMIASVMQQSTIIQVGCYIII